MKKLLDILIVQLVLLTMTLPPCTGQNLADKLKFISCYYENASPLIWDFQGDTAIKITFLYDYERESLNRQSTHINLRVEAEPGTELNLLLSGFEDIYNGVRKTSYGRSSGHNISCYFSEDYHEWQGVETNPVQGNNFDLQVKYTMKTNRVFVAKLPVYSLEHLGNFKKEIIGHRNIKFFPIGHTVEKRPLEILRVGNPAAKHNVLIRARAHAWEPGGNWVVEGIVRGFIEKSQKDDSPAKEICWYILPMANMDGVYRGMTRFNANGIDLNRGWGVMADSLLAPENYFFERFVMKLVGENKTPDFFIDLHNDNYGNIHMYEPTSGNPEYSMSVEKFFNLMKEITWFSNRLQKDSNPDPKRYYSYAGLYERYGIPGCVLELNSDWIENKKRIPSAEDWLELGRMLNDVFFDYFK